MISFTPLCYNVNTQYDVFYPTRWCLSGLAWDRRQGSISCHRAQSSLPTSWQRVCVSTTPSPPWPVSPAMIVWLVRTKVVGFVRTVWEQRLLVLWEQWEKKGCWFCENSEEKSCWFCENSEREKITGFVRTLREKVVDFYCTVYCMILNFVQNWSLIQWPWWKSAANSCATSPVREATLPSKGGHPTQ